MKMHKRGHFSVFWHTRRETLAGCVKLWGSLDPSFIILSMPNGWKLCFPTNVNLLNNLYGPNPNSITKCFISRYRSVFKFCKPLYEIRSKVGIWRILRFYIQVSPYATTCDFFASRFKWVDLFKYTSISICMIYLYLKV